ncbi:MAG: hypothetical protein PUF10_09015 [Bacteroidales bacterium]|nr:hypothetical protein [Bacteroidales bacterium]
MKKLFLLSTLMLVMMVVILPMKLKASNYVTVTSFGTYDFSGKKFCILSNMENMPSDDVEFKEYAKYISYAFQMKDAIEVSSQSDEVEICVLMSFDVQDASYIRTVSQPVWGRTSISSVSARTTSSGTTYDYHYNYGVVDYKQKSEKVGKYIHYIDLFVYEINKDGTSEKMVWKASLETSYYKENLPGLFPEMAFHLYNYIGKTLRKEALTPDKGLFYFKNGVFARKDVTYNPYIENGCEQYTKRHSYEVWMVIQNDQKTSVFFVVNYNKSKCLLNNTYLQYKGEKYYFTRLVHAPEYPGEFYEPSEYNEGDKRIGEKAKGFYFRIDFPALPNDAKVFDFISQKKAQKSSKDDLIWRGIHLK